MLIFGYLFIFLLNYSIKSILMSLEFLDENRIYILKTCDFTVWSYWEFIKKYFINQYCVKLSEAFETSVLNKNFVCWP